MNLSMESSIERNYIISLVPLTTKTDNLQLDVIKICKFSKYVFMGM